MLTSSSPSAGFQKLSNQKKVVLEWEELKHHFSDRMNRRARPSLTQGRIILKSENKTVERL